MGSARVIDTRPVAQSAVAVTGLMELELVGCEAIELVEDHWFTILS